MKTLHMVAWVLLIVGGLNWLLVGLFQKDLFVMLGMDMTSIVPKIVYILVGLSALYDLFTHRGACKICSSSAPSGM